MIRSQRELAKAKSPTLVRIESHVFHSRKSSSLQERIREIRKTPFDRAGQNNRARTPKAAPRTESNRMLGPQAPLPKPVAQTNRSVERRIADFWLCFHRLQRSG